jgi:hypothetical protein
MRAMTRPRAIGSALQRTPFQTLRRKHCIVAAANRSSKVELEALAREILDKENALKLAFTPGQVMPSVRYFPPTFKSVS